MATLREIKETGWRLTVHCEGQLPHGWCAHYTSPSIDQLIQYFGADFDLGLNRAQFLSRFTCERCGSRRAVLRSVPPNDMGLMAGSGTAHHHGPMPSPEERKAKAEAFEAEFRRNGGRTNAELEAESKAARRARAKAAKEKARTFVGPPNPRSRTKAS